MVDVETDMLEVKSNVVYSMPASEVYQALVSRPQGLTGLDASERLKHWEISMNTSKLKKQLQAKERQLSAEMARGAADSRRFVL